MANLSRMFAIKLLDLLKLCVLCISCCLLCPNQKISDSKISVLVVGWIPLSTFSFLAVRTNIAEYCDKHYWVDIDKNSYATNIFIIMHTSLAIFIHFGSMCLVNLWYSPKMDKWFAAYSMNTSNYIKKRRYCLIAPMLFIIYAIFYRFWGKYYLLINILTAVMFGFHTSQVLDTWLCCERNMDATIPKLLKTIDQIIIKNTLLPLIDKFHAKLINDRSIFYVNIPFQHIIISKLTLCYWSMINFCHKSLIWVITIFQDKFGTVLFWIIYHSFAMLIGYFVFFMGSYVSKCLVINAVIGGIGVFIGGMILPAFNLNNLLLYDDQFIEVIYPQTYLEMVWLFYCKFIIFTLTGHIIIYSSVTLQVIHLSPHHQSAMDNTVAVFANLCVAYYIFNVWSFISHDIVILFHHYLLTSIKWIYFAIVGGFLYGIFFKYIESLIITNKWQYIKIKTNKTYSMVSYLEKKAYTQKMQVIMQLIEEILELPHPISMEIVSYIADSNLE